MTAGYTTFVAGAKAEKLEAEWHCHQSVSGI